MKLIVKLLNGQTFDLNITGDELVSNLKERIEKEHNHPASWQKLIYSGKILEDNTKISAAQIKEGDFVVLMVRKPKATPATTQTAPTSAEKPVEAKPTPVEQPKPQEAKPQEAKPQETKPVQQQQPSPAQPTTPSSGLVTGSEYEATLQSLVDMGFDRSEVIRAMRAAFNNPERAVEYLTNGIPEMPEFAPQQTGGTMPPPQQPQQPSQPSQPSQPASAFPQTSGSSTAFPNFTTPQSGQPSPFDFLRQHPQFNALRMMIQANPQLLQPVLQQLGQQNPQLLQLINQHQNEFMQLLNEPVQQGSSGGQPPSGFGFGQGGTPGSGSPGGPQYIQITQEEKAAIERLEGMGFERSLVLEAYFACDKDETLAANYLLEHAADDFEEMEDQNPTS